ncbi:MAG: BCD family MFS transporter [Opitutaceae bacterium]|nr:BCD family MFS transporter [Opitutaceae bacterium]
MRLAAFPVAYGLSGVLIGGTLNRVMIAELDVPATLVALLFAIPLLLSPLRLWFGYRSDGHPLFGRRREPYLILGAFVIGGGLYAIAWVTGHHGTSLPLFAAAGAAAFLLYGLGRNLAHNSYQALVAERFTDRQRGRAMTLYEVATLVGAVAGAGLIGRAMEHYDPTRLLAVAGGVALAVWALTLVAAPGQETATVSVTRAERVRAKPFAAVLRDYVLADPQVRRLFIVVIFTFTGTLAQDVLLEPYGALVLGLSVGQTTRLTMFWGLGVLAAMLLSGLVLLRSFGALRLMRMGLALSIMVFASVGAVGLAGAPEYFRWLVLGLGFCAGLTGAGMLASVVQFTTPERAGLLMGVWGMANMVGHAVGSLMGGAIVDTMRLATGSALTAYTTLFAAEVALLIVALKLSLTLNPTQTRAQAEFAEPNAGES